MARNKREKARKRNNQKKNEQKKYKNIISIILIISLPIILLLSFKIINTEKIKMENISKIQKQQNEADQIFSNEDYSKIEGEQYKQKDTNINIIALGNILYEYDLYESLYDDYNDTYLFVKFLENAKQCIEASDYKIANLGVNFIGDYAVKKGKTNSPLDLSLAIKSIGINLLNTANRNSNDEGKEGITKTLEQLDKQNILHTGTARAEIERKTPVIEDIRGIKVAFLSYTENLNKSIDKKDNYMINKIDKTEMKEDIKNAKEKGAEFVIVIINWDNIENSNITKTQKEIVEYLANNGANLILGNNNNGIIQKFDMIENNEGQNVGVAYSIGNFISNNKNENTRIKIAIDVTITKSVENNEIKIKRVNYKPMYLLDKGENSEGRYILIDVNKEIERYEQGFPINLDEEKYKMLIEKIENLEKTLKGE